MRENASHLASEGHRLRQALIAWRAINSDLLDLVTDFTGDAVDHTGLLANAFSAATSIYLSGIYDYTIALWHSWGVSVPTLAMEDVKSHVVTILDSTRYALDHTNISHLLYLFPLRVAGARCTDQCQRNQVLTLLRRVGTNFVVAQAFEGDLRRLWAKPQV